MELIGSLIDVVYWIWRVVTRDRPPSRESAARTIAEVNAANERLKIHGMRSQPK